MTTSNGQSKEPSKLIKAAMEAGAEPENPEQVNPHFSKAKTVDETIGNGKINFFPELDKIKFDELSDREFIIWRSKIIPEFNSKFGTSDLCLLMIETADGNKHTTAASGIAIKRQIKAFEKTKSYPVKVHLTKQMNPDKPGQDYWLFT